MKKTVGLAAAALLTLSMAACSGDGGDDAYCDRLEEARDSIEDVDTATLDQETFDDITSQLNDLSEEAPSDVEDQYQTVIDGFDEIAALFEEAGISFDDLDSLQSGDLPEGVDLEKLQELAPRFEEISTDTSIEDAIDEIQTDAEERCDITFEDTEN